MTTKTWTNENGDVVTLFEFPEQLNMMPIIVIGGKIY